MEVFQDIYIDLYNGNTETISVNQNDNGARKIRCYVQLCGSDWIIPNDVKVNIKVKKPNGYGVYKQIGNDNFGEISKNIITIPITTEMTNCDGRLFCTLEFVSGSDIIHSFMFYIKVNKIAFSNEDIIDTNDYKTILDYVEQAKKYMELSKEYSNDSYDSSINSNRYAENSQSSATAASLSASKSKTSETNAKTSETNSKSSEINSKNSELNSKTSEINSKQSESNSKSYYEKTKQISDSITNALKPCGTITFANLPTNPSCGHMYNISDNFITDDRFRDGIGKNYSAGTNVYYANDNMWDCLAGEYPTRETNKINFKIEL